jgi:hypothetical protein
MSMPTPQLALRRKEVRSMIRRRRRSREIAFSFDSFLDVVANVVGIIIRLILVVWVGARSYGGLADVAPPPEPPAVVEVAAEEGDAPAEGDPLEGELAAERRQLAAAEAALREQLEQLDLNRERLQLTDHELELLAERSQALTKECTKIEQGTEEAKKAAQATALSAEELRQRLRRLAEEIKAIQAQPSKKKVVRYRTPVSKPVEAEELLFECHKGRVTFIDIAALIDEVKRTLHDKGEALKSTWEVSDVAGPVGPYQLRYTVERLRDSFPDAIPDSSRGFSYGLSAWYVEPITEVRGETLEQALKPGSEFRQIVDGLDPQFGAVTFWVYADSFPLYRQLRDYLYERDLVVAGRPLPEGAQIASTRHGTVSRGQ